MTQGTNYRWVTAVIAGLSAGLIAAIVAPRYFDDSAVSWIITVVVTLAVGGAVALASRERIDEGVHVRDDALPPE